MSRDPQIRIGCAGWNVGRDVQDHFPTTGSHLQRYAAVLPAVEINSSFYRPHKPVTYRRWASDVPSHFRFSAKVPKRITHELRLLNCDDLIRRFIDEVENLGERLGVLLVQLPPSLVFEERTAAQFFKTWRGATTTSTVCEPRHTSWFSEEAKSLLRSFDVGRVGADPPPTPGAEEPKGSTVHYFRLHGSPKIYYSNYGDAYLMQLARRLSDCQAAECWCIFDNTAEGAALRNALQLAVNLPLSRS